MFAFGVNILPGEYSPKESEQDISAVKCSDVTPIYTVKPGDKLYEIGDRFGSMLFWEAIYIANADLIDNPDLIYVGQQLEIPSPIASYRDGEAHLNTILENPFCSVAGLPLSEVDHSKIFLYDLNTLQERADREYKLRMAEQTGESAGDEQKRGDDIEERFREAFEAVVEMEGGTDEQAREEAQRNSEQQLMMELDGMIHDETRSKVGRDFYDVFYSNWQSPPEAYNFSINISEQPSPSLGTIIYVEVNDTETFRMRLQPRYDFIQQAGQYAVRQTYSHLQNNDYQLQIY